jgi:hypothetical protein
MEFYCDNKRHLICKPYSVANLHRMAQVLNINKCFYHTNPWPHYDIPARRIEEVTAKCILVTDRDIVKIYRESL